MMHEAYSEHLPLEFFEDKELASGDAMRTGRESYIPIRKDELVRHLSSDTDLSAEERHDFSSFCRVVEVYLHAEFRRRLDAVKSAYAVFDPDADTKSMSPISSTEQDALAPEAFDRIVELLERANFRRLSTMEIENAVEAASEWGLRLDVDFKAFERLLVYARGDVIGRRIRRRWTRLYRPEEVDVPIYQRLVVVFRLSRFDSEVYADKSKIYLKLFKNIPKIDVDMLLPGTQVRMSLFDRVQIFLPTVTGLGIALFKIFKGAVILAVAGLYGFIALLGFVGGTLGYAFRSFVGYMRTKDRYQLSLTRSLYFQNLATNSGVLFRLLDEAEDQELREVLLAYFLLWRKAGERGLSSEHLDREAEAYLFRATRINVDFEVTDALRKLATMGLIQSLPTGHWVALSPAIAISQLRELTAKKKR